MLQTKLLGFIYIIIHFTYINLSYKEDMGGCNTHTYRERGVDENIAGQILGT